MTGRFVFSVFLVLLVVAGIVGVGAYAYSIGIAQGMAESGKLVAPATGVVPVPYYGWSHPFGLVYGLVSCLVPLFIIFVLFSVMRNVFCRVLWGGVHHRKWEGGVPPKVEEWHRKMHEQQPAAQK